MGVSVRIVRQAAITGGGPTQDFTVSGFGTPKVAIFIVTAAVTDGTIADDAKLSVGASDGVRSRVAAFRGKDGSASTDNDERSNRNSVILIINTNNANVDGEASWDSWITDGVRITYGNLPSTAVLVTCIMVNGSDASAHVSGFRSRKTINDICEVSRLSGTCTNVGAADSGGTGQTRVDVSGTPFAATDEGNIFVFNATGNEYTVAEFIDSNTVDLQGDASGESNTDTFIFEGPDFTTDLLIAFGDRGEPDDLNSAVIGTSLGFCDLSDFTQTSVNLSESNAKADGSPQVYLDTTHLQRNLFDVNTFGNVEINARDSTGFDVKTPATADQHVMYVALAFNGAVGFKVWNFTTPSSDGESTDGGPGFVPQFVMYAMTQETNVNANQGTAEAGSFGISTFTADEAFCNTIMLEDTATTINDASLSDDLPVHIPDDDQTTGPSATFVSMAATGPRLDWSDTAQGASMDWAGLAIEEFTASGVANPWYQYNQQLAGGL